MIERPQVLEAGRAGRTHAADRATEERVAGEHVEVVDDEVEHPAGVARGVQRADLEPALRDHLAGLNRAVDALHELRLDRVGIGGDVVLAAPGVGLGDVVVVMMREQQQVDLEPEPLGGIEQRPRRATGVDHDSGPALIGQRRDRCSTANRGAWSAR